MRISSTSAAAFSHDDLLAVTREIRQHLIGLGIAHHRTYRHAQNLILGIFPMLRASHPVTAALGFVVRLITEIN